MIDDCLKLTVYYGERDRVTGGFLADALVDVFARHQLQRPIATLERVRVRKRDGRRLAKPRHVPDNDHSGLQTWQKLGVYASEQSRHDGAALYSELMVLTVAQLAGNGSRVYFNREDVDRGPSAASP